MYEKIGTYLISEAPNFDNELRIVKNKGKYLVMEAILQDFKVNRNVRLYPRDVLIAGLNSDYIKERIATKSWLMEYGHPLNADISRQLHYDMDNIAAILTSFSVDDEYIRGVVEAADTWPTGNNFANLVRQGMKAAFSMRGLSDVIEKKGNVTVVKGPLVIFCYDVVVNPSHSSAYMTKIVSEDFKKLSNEARGILSESGFNFNEKIRKEAGKFVKENSPRIKRISEQFEFNPEVEVISEDKVRLSGDHNMEIMVEDFISNNYKNYLSKF